MNTFVFLTNYYGIVRCHMKKIYPRYTLRVSNVLLFKLAFVTDFYGRSKNREIENIIKKHVEDFEKKYGVIPVPENIQQGDSVE